MELDEINSGEDIEIPRKVETVFDETSVKHDSMDTESTVPVESQISAEQQTENSTVSKDVADQDLRQFDILDDLEQHNNQDGSDSYVCSNDSMDSDIPDDEIEAMLEEGLPDEFKGKRMDKRNDMLYEEKEKLVLDEIGHNHFDVLPEGWVQVIIKIVLKQMEFIII